MSQVTSESSQTEKDCCRKLGFAAHACTAVALTFPTLLLASRLVDLTCCVLRLGVCFVCPPARPLFCLCGFPSALCFRFGEMFGLGHGELCFEFNHLSCQRWFGFVSACLRVGVPSWECDRCATPVESWTRPLRLYRSVILAVCLRTSASRGG